MLDLGAILIPTLSPLEKIMRPLIVYLAIAVIIHLAGKRELAQVNTFDLVVLLLISNVVQNATIGDDSSILGGLLGAAALVGTNYLVVRFLFRHARIDRLIEGAPTVLIQDGRIEQANLTRELITESELLAALRRQGVRDPLDVSLAMLETGGAISVIERRPDTEARRHTELLTRLDDLAKQLAQLRRPAAEG